MLSLDHLVVTAQALDQGAAWVEQALGVGLVQGGRHARMGTWNRLLKLGPKLYLEVIAPDPGAPAPTHPRWYALDRAEPVPALSHWVLATDDLQAALASVPLPLGPAMDFARDRYRWRMGVPGDGCLPYDGAAPALIEWQTGGHPADNLPDAGCRLLDLTVSHPRIGGLVQAFPALGTLPMLRIEPGGFSIQARIETPTGTWTLP